MKQVSLNEMKADPPQGTIDLNLPLSFIGALHQMRSRMSLIGIDDLVESIKQMGQQMPGIMVALARQEAAEYLRNINEMWGTNYQLRNFRSVHVVEKGEALYFFLIAGHRRLKAVEMAKLSTLYVRVYFESSFMNALLMQYHENVHEQVPPDNEARFITLFWRKAKNANPDLPLAHFARSLGKKPEVVRRSIRFTALPIPVQELVVPNNNFKKGIAYSLLCELARLQEAYAEAGKPYSEAELMHFAYTLVAECKTAKRAAAWVSERITVLHGQEELFELSPQEAADGARRTVGTTLEKTVRVGEEHLRVVARFHANGSVNRVASGAAVSAVSRTLAVASELAPEIVQGLKGARGVSKIRERLGQTLLPKVAQR